jgi:cold shock CspA family protein
MKKGIVKLVDKTRGFGFITKDDDKKDMYFGLTDVKKGEALQAGDSVTFETEKTAQGMKAIKVAKAT